MAISCNDNGQTNIESNKSNQQNISNLNESNKNISKIQPNTQTVNSGQIGIWVNGQSKIMTEPDMVEMSVGIESTSKIVSESVQTVATDHAKLMRYVVPVLETPSHIQMHPSGVGGRSGLPPWQVQSCITGARPMGAT